MSEKQSFILYYNYYNQLALLSMKERGELITAVFEYELFGTVPEQLPPLVQMAFSIIRDALERDRATYEAVCRRNQENGRRGGRPKKAREDDKTEDWEEKPKKADHENGNENGNGNENENGNKNKNKNKNKMDMALSLVPEGKEQDCGAVLQGSEGFRVSPWEIPRRSATPFGSASTPSGGIRRL